MRRSTQKSLSALVGAVIMTGSALGVLHGVRAGAAQIIYRQTKAPNADAVPPAPEAAAEKCEWSSRLYPHNYYFSIWMSEWAYYQRFDPLNGREIPGRVEVAETWCDRGLRQNFYDRQLRAMKTYLLARKSPVLAAEFWEKYVDWDFWEPHNHAMLVGLHARAGDYDEALAALQWVKGTEHEADARKELANVLALERRPPRAPSTINPQP